MKTFCLTAFAAVLGLASCQKADLTPATSPAVKATYADASASMTTTGGGSTGAAAKANCLKRLNDAGYTRNQVAKTPVRAGGSFVNYLCGCTGTK